MNHMPPPNDPDPNFQKFIHELDEQDSGKHGFMACAIITAVSIFSVTAILLLILNGCRPQLTIAAPPITLPELPTTSAAPDTFLQVVERTVTDTLQLPGDTLVVLDSVPCPPGLTRDSIFRIEKKVYLPGKTVTVERVRRDTLRVVVNQAPALPGGGGSGSRISIIIIGLFWVIVSLVGAWLTRKNPKKQF